MRGQVFFLFFFLIPKNFLWFNFTHAKLIKNAELEFTQHCAFNFLTMKTAIINICCNVNLKKFEKPDGLCNLTKNRKIALCNAVLTDEDVFEDLRMFLNKVGIIRNKDPHNCEEHSVKVDMLNFLLPTEIPYLMFPCYGRHDPVRSRWDLDDYYNVIFLSEGPTFDSLFIFVRNLNPRSETYVVYGLITDISVNNIPEVNFEEEELEYELETLKNISYNGDIKEIEVLYLRNVVFTSSSRIREKICNLNIEQKMALCVQILSDNVYRKLFWEFNKEAFIQFKCDCELKKIEFVYWLGYNDLLILREMYPCYGTVDGSNLLYLSEGFRDNSVLVYFKFGSDTYSFLEFIENVKLDDVSANDND